MLEHHKKSLENLINYFKNDPNVISIILGGSVAKECERVDSDLDGIIDYTPLENYAEVLTKLIE